MTERDAVPPGYKRTEVGVIPEGWEIKRFGDIVKIRNLKIFPSNVDLNTLCIELEHIEQNDGRLNGHSEARYSTSSKYLFYKGDVLFGRLRSYLRKYWLSDADGICSTEIWPFFTNPKIASNNFIFWVVQTNRFIDEASISYGTHMPRADWGVIQNLMIPYPLLPEQHAIAAALSDVDGLIGALDALIAKKRDMKQAAMQQLLTGRTRLPGFEGEWEEKRLGDLAEIDPENLSNSTNLDYCFNYISLEQVDNGRLIGYSEEVFRSSPSRARRKLKKGDVLMSTVRPNLMSHLLYNNQVNNAVCSTGFAVIRAKVGLSEPGFLFNQLFGYVVNNQIEKIIAGSNYPAINSRDVKLIEIPCPPTLHEQTAIATVLSDMDAEIAALERRRDKAKEIKQGMMQQLLTGKVRLVSPEEMGEHNNNMVQA